MAAAQYIGVSGVARKVKNQHIGVSNVARKVKAGYIGVNGVARKCYAGETITRISGSSVTPDANGRINYGRTVPVFSKVTGSVDIISLDFDIYYGSTVIGRVTGDLSVNGLSTTNGSYTVDVTRQCSATWYESGSSLTRVELSLSFARDYLVGGLEIVYFSGSGNNERTKSCNLSATYGVDYTLDFTS